MSNRYSMDELLSIVIAREIRDYENVVIGAGIPVTACVLAKGLHAKNANLMTEAGLIDFDPLVPLIGIADVSASKVIENLKDYEYFKNNTPEPTHSFYEVLLKLYIRNENHIKEILEVTIK